MFQRYLSRLASCTRFDAALMHPYSEPSNSAERAFSEYKTHVRFRADVIIEQSVVVEVGRWRDVSDRVR